MTTDEERAEAATQPSAVVWHWAPALLMAVASIPAAFVAAVDVPAGIALAVGMIPAVAVGIAPNRGRRAVVLLAGPLIGIAMLLGSAVSTVPVAALLVLFAVSIAAVWVTRLPRLAVLGGLTTSLVLPMIGVGLSYQGVTTALALTGLFVAGSIWVWLVSLAVPETPTLDRPAPLSPPPLSYGVVLGAVAVVTAGLGFLLDLDHIGWACAAALLVMRPDPDVRLARSLGRVGSVVTGATAASLMALWGPPDIAYSAAIVLVLAAAGAMHGSRLYIFPAFTTYFVIVLLTYSTTADVPERFLERIVETVVGVSVALVAGVALSLSLAKRPGATSNNVNLGSSRTNRGIGHSRR